MLEEKIGQQVKMEPEMWLEEHGDVLYRFAMTRVGRADAAEDLVQETLLAAVRAASSFEGRSTVRTWLIGIMKNKILDYLRANSRQQARESSQELEEVLDASFTRLGIWKQMLGNWGSNPDDLLEQKEFMNAFQGCMAKLPEKHRAAFALTTFDSMDSGEICKVLEITPSNYWVLMHRARMALRKCLESGWLSGG